MVKDKGEDRDSSTASPSSDVHVSVKKAYKEHSYFQNYFSAISNLSIVSSYQNVFATFSQLLLRIFHKF